MAANEAYSRFDDERSESNGARRTDFEEIFSANDHTERWSYLKKRFSGLKNLMNVLRVSPENGIEFGSVDKQRE
jgi:hypothetical protein